MGQAHPFTEYCELSIGRAAKSGLSTVLWTRLNARVPLVSRREREKGLTGSITESQPRRRWGVQDFQAQVQSDPGFKKHTVPKDSSRFSRFQQAVT
jgi:hypothetical protein